MKIVNHMELYAATALIKPRDHRAYCSHLFITAKHVYCTDSKALIRFDNSLEWEPGVYTLARRTKKEIEIFKTEYTEDDFPDFDRMFETSGLDTEIEVGDPNILHYAIVKQADMPIDFKYAQAATLLSPDTLRACEGMVILSSYSASIAIMGFRV